MKFIGTLYSYQLEILDVFEKQRKIGDKKIHIVAPPGSGKTIVGIEMMCRIDAPTLILVPNLTLQEQWKDKLEKMFLEAHEKSEELISTQITTIKKINIITYQSLSGTDTDDDSVNEKILDIWFQREKDEFDSREKFDLFVLGLKEENPEEYGELYGKARKKLKESGESDYTRKLMKGTIHEYVGKLREAGVQSMIVDEAHHLTSWWSHVLYEIWMDLNEPYIIGLTATPPFENADYFELDENYSKLLGTVDYYVPTPAIVKSGRLAPYSDLLYIVSPDESLEKILKDKEVLLENFLELHKDEVCIFLHTFLKENYSRLETKSLDLLEKWMRFVYIYRDESLDMSSYINKNARDPLTLEDIAKSIGKWANDNFKKTKKSNLLDEVKILFFDLGYIWRGANLYRFETPIEKGLIYSKSKIDGVLTILRKEEENLDSSFRAAIITDFLDIESDWINGHYIFDEVVKNFPHLNPYLISGQGIWKFENGTKILASEETVLSVTEKLSDGETKCVIGTRGILGEGWDCPKLNTLIDLTGVSAYMSVNQVHGRAIRLDRDNPEKVANIYDIVCIGEGFQGMRDFERLKKKHAQFYGVNDSGLIIKELDHIYPQLERVISDKEKINAYMLKKLNLRAMVKELWGIGGEYKNEEVFSLSIEIIKPYEVVPLPSKISWWKLSRIRPEKWKNENVLELGKSSYHWLVRTWIEEILDAALQVMKSQTEIPGDFRYILSSSDTGSITISSKYRDPLIGKKFIESIVGMFGPVTNEKYIYIQKKNEKIGILDYKRKIEGLKLYFAGCSILISGIIGPWYLFQDNLKYGIVSDTDLALLIGFSLMLIGLLFIISKREMKNSWYKLYNAFLATYKDTVFGNKVQTLYIGLPEIISSNNEKRERFTGKDYGAIPESAKWYDYVKNIRLFDWINTERVTKFIVGCIISPFLLFILMGLVYWIPWLRNILHFMGTFIPIIGYSIVIIIGLLLLAIVLKKLLSLIHLLYVGFAKMHNFLKRRSVIGLSGKIQATSQSDIGQPSFLSAKIEKLWI